MSARGWLDATDYPLSDGRHTWLAQMGAAVLVVVFALFVASLSNVDHQAAATVARTGLPDGNRATGIYAMDGGEGLGEGQYADIVLRMTMEERPLLSRQPAQHQ